MRSLCLAVLSLLLAGCAGMEVNRTNFTELQQQDSRPYGFVHVRLSPRDPDLAVRLENDVRQQLKAHPQTDVSILALSGGGADGAFGAGVLTAWSRRGDRPEFTVVTGVSTGALIAPFAFLGPRYDRQLTEAYTSGLSSRMLRRKWLAALTTPGIFSSKALEALVARYVDTDLVRAIAAENDKGRRLVVATTNLDSQSGVIWDIGAIASQGVARGPAGELEARDLIRKVLVASASVPGAFAPVMIPSQLAADGTAKVVEMHVDGSVTLPFFILPDSMLNWRVPRDIAVRGHVYVLINGNIGTHFAVTPFTNVAVATRSLDSLTRAQARSTLEGIRGFACRNRFGMSVAAIPDDFKGGGLLAFDQACMQRVYKAGFTLQAEGKAFDDHDGCDALPE